MATNVVVISWGKSITVTQCRQEILQANGEMHLFDCENIIYEGVMIEFMNL